MAGGSSKSQSWVLVGLVAGATLGCLVNYAVTKGGMAEFKPYLDRIITYFAKPIGDIFMNLIFLAIVPLVFSSLVVGITRLGGTANVGRIGFKTLAYFIITTACAAFIGLTLVNLIKPGEQVPQEMRDALLAEHAKEANTKSASASFGIDTFVNIVPKNPLKSLVEKDMLAIIFLSVLVGVALTQIEKDKAELISKFLEGVNQITDFIIRLAMRIAPVAVFALIFVTTARMGYEILIALGAFVGTVLGGLAIHLLVVLPILVLVFGGMNPIEFFRKIRMVMITAFTTSSSSATLPNAMQCAENELGIPEKISRFVLPLSASMNHNGTALFEGVTVFFLAQVYGFDLPLENQLMVLILCVLTATGMAGVPGGSLPLIGIILTTATEGKVPPAAIAIVLGVDRLLDMCRTTVNVVADMTTAVYVARSEAKRAVSP
jgi:dicarboxylate/amino acid:cation (Na+ or H+) symporter, DAACS family